MELVGEKNQTKNSNPHFHFQGKKVKPLVAGGQWPGRS